MRSSESPSVADATGTVRSKTADCLRIGTLVLLAVGLQACIHNSNSDDSSPAAAVPANYCDETTTAAYNACQSEVEDDYWIAIGNCNNLADADDRTDCMAEADEERAEVLPECDDQADVRDEICAALGGDPYDPEIDAANFLDAAGIVANPNPYFPLIPGTVLIFENEDEGETITVTVTDETKEILGVTCIVVHDVVTSDGEVIEDTNDWYAQDIDGNVWYFGEIALNFEDGELVDIEGSWTAGVDGAKPGILMKAMPMVGDVYRQEFFLGDAEDMGEVLSVTGTEMVPAAACDGTCVVTRDYSPLEPDVEEHKYYAPGIGTMLEVDPESGVRVELVEIISP